MTKRNSRTPNKSDNQIETTIERETWIATNSLDPRDNGKSNMKEEKLAEAKLLFKDNAVLILPSESNFADFYRAGWVCFYYYPFGIGMKFPFSKLVFDVIPSQHVSPAQLMPSAWRTLACLDAIVEKHKLRIDANVVKYSYTINKFSNCRYSLVNKNKDDQLILNNETVNDRGWKGEYFFVEKSSLGDDADYLLDKWNVEGIKSNSFCYLVVFFYYVLSNSLFLHVVN